MSFSMFSKFGSGGLLDAGGSDPVVTVNGVISRDLNGLPIPPCVCPRGGGAYVNNQGNCICAPDTVELDASGNPITWNPTAGYFPYPHDFYIAPSNSGNSLSLPTSFAGITEWAKTNPLMAAAVGLGIYLILIKK